VDEQAWDDNIWVLERLTGNIAYLRVAHWIGRDVIEHSCMLIDSGGNVLFRHQYPDSEFRSADFISAAADTLARPELEEFAGKLQQRRQYETDTRQLMLSGVDPHENPQRYYFNAKGMYLYLPLSQFDYGFIKFNNPFP